MNDTKKTLPGLINDSALSSDDKKMFIAFLENISEEDTIEMTESFTANPQEIVIFWTVLKAKMTMLSIIESNDNLSHENKTKLTNQIIAMNDEEFNAFLNGIGQMSESKNPEETMQNLIREQKESHEEFMMQSKDFLKKLRDSHKELQEDKDEEDYDDTLAKINSLKS